MTQPLFSVLLPTRNRLALAKDAIGSVLRQAYPHWELVISDNCSEEDVGGYVAGLNEPRIRYSRSDTFLPVTANWNRTLDAARGDYVIMLGDDDALVPGYFERVLELVADLGQPDFLYHGAWHYTFPGVDPDLPGGRLQDQTARAAFLRNRTAATLLPVEEAREAALRGLNLQMVYGFNMQYFLFSRAFLRRMRDFGPVFQGPFPDFYAANMAMLVADRIGVVPEPLVVIGISPKSYGFFHVNQREAGGVALLNIGTQLQEAPDHLAHRLLPGTVMSTSWLLSVDIVRERLQGILDVPVGVGRYRMMQIYHVLRCEAEGRPCEARPRDIWPLLDARERWLARAMRLAMFPARLLPTSIRPGWVALLRRLTGRGASPEPAGLPPPLDGRYATMAEVLDSLSTAPLPEHGVPS